MPDLYISEYARQALDTRGLLPAPEEPPIASQKIAISGSSALSAPFNAKTRFVMIHSDVICSYRVGAAPTATAADARMAAGDTRFFGVDPGLTAMRLAVISNV
jgi:hypothetical protein